MLEIQTLEPQPGVVSDCVTKNDDTGFIEEGYALWFKGVDTSQKTEYAVARLARRFGQLAVVRLHPHVWGSDTMEHATVLQKVIPTGAGLHELVFEHPVYLATDKPAQGAGVPDL